MKKLGKLTLSELKNEMSLMGKDEAKGLKGGTNYQVQITIDPATGLYVFNLGDAMMPNPGTTGAPFSSDSTAPAAPSWQNGSDYQNFYDGMQTMQGSIGPHTGEINASTGLRENSYTTQYDGSKIYAYADSDGHCLGSWNA